MKIDTNSENHHIENNNATTFNKTSALQNKQHKLKPKQRQNQQIGVPYTHRADENNVCLRKPNNYIGEGKGAKFLDINHSNNEIIDYDV